MARAASLGCRVVLCLLGCRYYKVNSGQRPGVLLVYRDGVSDGELARVRLDEVTALIQVR